MNLFRFVPLEALAAGLPVFAYASGAIVETLEKAPYSWVVPKGDYVQMATLIMETIKQTNNWDIFAGYEYVNENFNINRAVVEIEKIYKDYSMKI